MHRVGIRREDKNEWERRAPLTPDHVAELVASQGLAFSVEPSPLRTFADDDYRAAGAAVEPLDGCRVILGIKEIPQAALRPGRTYAYFSHTAKGQPHNMGMLRRMLELGSTLVDYERIVDERARRLVFFGRHAGYAGMIDALWALGQRIDALGLATPFAEIRLAHDYAGLDEATHHISRVGERLRQSGLPTELRPLVFAFTGSGNVTLGAREILDRLPTVEIDLEELASLEREPERPRNVVYRVSFSREQRFERSAGGAVELAELDAHPDRYRSGVEPWLDRITVLVHGAFWSANQPRLVTREGLARLWDRTRTPKLLLIADISCDVAGAIEATVRTTTPGDPVYVYDPASGAATPGLRGRGPVVLAIDNLPCQLPVESSEHFGDTLLRFVPMLARCDWDRPFEMLALPRELEGAVIAHRGRLTPGYAWLERHL
jgi:alpha-aminoadipic semialdehyde synthase